MFLKGLKYSMIAVAVALALTGCDEEKKETVAPAATQQQAPKAQQKAETKDVKADDAKAESKDFGSLEKNASYAIGSMIGTDLKNNFVEANKKLEIAVDPELIKAGFIDAISGNAKLSKEEAVEKLEKFSELFEKKAKEQAAKKSAENLQKGKDFLAQNAKNENVKVTASGLQYLVKVEGTGEKVKDATDTVKVVYTGKLIDGTVFDSNDGEGKQPIEFPLENVIPGWTEGLQLMSVGSEYTFFIPSELAYGPQDAGFIPANSVLVFDVKLLDVKHKDVKAESKDDAKADVKAESKDDVKADVKAESKDDAKADVKAESKDDVKADAKAESKADVKAESKDDAKADAKAESKEDAKDEKLPEVNEVDLNAELAKEPVDQPAK